MEIEIASVRAVSASEIKITDAGSSPPKKRWSMEFYYPNLNNDMWRIEGMLFFNDKNHFLNSKPGKRSAANKSSDFLNDKGIALFDTASAIRRLQDNASDKFLEVVEPTHIAADYCGNFPNAKQSSQRAKRQQIHSDSNSKWKNPK